MYRNSAFIPIPSCVTVVVRSSSKSKNRLRVVEHGIEDKELERSRGALFEAHDGQAVAAVLEVDGR